MKFVRFDQRDVVRHRIVQSVVNAYEIFEKQKADDAAAAAANGNGNGNANGNGTRPSRVAARFPSGD